MSLLERLDSDLKTAIKSKDETASNCLRMLKSSLKYEAIRQKKDSLEEAEIIAVIRKQVKQRKDSQEAFIKGNRPELAQKEEKETEILTAYLPASLSDADLQKFVKQAIEKTGAKTKADKGKVMKETMTLVRGQADGSRVSQFVDQSLS